MAFQNEQGNEVVELSDDYQHHSFEPHRGMKKRQNSCFRYGKLDRLSPVGIFHTDAQGRCIHVNQRWS